MRTMQMYSVVCVQKGRGLLIYVHLVLLSADCLCPAHVCLLRLFAF